MNKKKFYQKQWFMWVLLIFLAPIGIITMWLIHKDDISTKKKSILSAISICLFILALMSPDKQQETSLEPIIVNESIATPTEEVIKPVHLYDSEYTEIRDVYNGFGTEKIGEYSLTLFAESDLTDELILDYYNNYIQTTDYNWYMIMFTDSDEQIGLYTNNGFGYLNKVYIEENGGEYMCGESLDWYYFIRDNGTTVIQSTFEDMYGGE